MPVDEEKVRLQDRHRNRWTPVRVEPQRVFLSWLQWGHATAPSRRFSIAPIACIRASSDRSAARNSFNCGPVRLPSAAQSLLNDLPSMIDPPFIRSAKTLRTPFGYQNKPETTRFSDMAKVHETWQYLASRRVMSLMLAINVQAVELARDFSQSFARRRHLPSHAKVRSTTHRRGRTSKPFAVSERLMISMVQAPWPLRAALSLPPA